MCGRYMICTPVGKTVDIVKKNMKKEVKRIKNFYKECESLTEEFIKNEHLNVIEKIKNIYTENN